jgi:hypothetical protein
LKARPRTAERRPAHPRLRRAHIAAIRLDAVAYRHVALTPQRLEDARHLLDRHGQIGVGVDHIPTTGGETTAPHGRALAELTGMLNHPHGNRTRKVPGRPPDDLTRTIPASVVDNDDLGLIRLAREVVTCSVKRAGDAARFVEGRYHQRQFGAAIIMRGLLHHERQGR